MSPSWSDPTLPLWRPYQDAGVTGSVPSMQRVPLSQAAASPEKPSLASRWSQVALLWASTAPCSLQGCRAQHLPLYLDRNRPSMTGEVCMRLHVAKKREIEGKGPLDAVPFLRFFWSSFSLCGPCSNRIAVRIGQSSSLGGRNEYHKHTKGQG